MRTTLAGVCALMGAVFAGCGGGSATAPASSTTIDHPATPLIGPAVESTAGMVEGAIGVASLRIDPEAATAEIVDERGLTSQGDLYELSIRPFLRARNMAVTGVRREPSGDLTVSVHFTHPFAAPANLDRPATGVKRIDLHVFDVNALVIADGTNTFFAADGPVTGNVDLLTNADAYRDPGATFDKAAMGIATANIFPYKLIAQNIDTGNPTGNYAPSANGWTGANLLAPTGYDVFPQGGAADVDFSFNLTGGAVDFKLITLAKYMDPRSLPSPSTKRLPDPLDMTALQYVLPEAAGDIQRIAATVTGTLVANRATDTAQLDLEILDWDHAATIAATFPNNANLNEISEVSDVSGIRVDFPDLNTASSFAGTGVSGTAPLITSGALLTNVALFNPTADTTVTGLVRVEDTQDADNGTDATKPLGLDESLAPAGTLSSTRYQVARVLVEKQLTLPVMPIYAPGAWALNATVGIPFNLDLDSATTTASDPEGISQYRVDYNNDSTFDATIGATNGADLPDFLTSYTYLAPGPQTIVLEVTDGDLPPSVNTATYTVNVSAQIAAVLDPLPVPGGINSDQGNSTIAVVVGNAVDILAPESNGQMYYGLRRTGGSNGWYVYRSTNGGGTWTTPGNLVPAFASGLITGFSNHFSIGILANGNPCIAVVDNLNDLGFLSGADSGTTVNWGPASNGVEIETASTWRNTSVLCSPTDADRVYILARNTSGTLGPKPQQINLYLSTNASSANPTFTLLNTAADTDGPTTLEGDVYAKMDSLGDIHVTWISSSVNSTDEVAYRKFDDDGSPGGGTWTGLPIILTDGAYIDGDVNDSTLALDSANRPVVVFADDKIGGSSNGDIFISKMQPSGTFSTPRQVNNDGGVDTTNYCVFPGVVVDATGRNVIVWRDNRTQPGEFEPNIAVFSADGYTKLLNDLLVLDAPDTIATLIHPRIDLDPISGKFIVTCHANTAGTVADGRARYRRLSIP